MARLFSIRPTLTIKGRRFRGIRGWAGKPTHPPLTDFPIVCYVLAAGCDLVSFIAARNAPAGGIDDVARSFFEAATIVIVAGAVVSLGTATTGFFDWWKGLPRERDSGFIGKAKHTQAWRTANWHMTVMLTVTAIVIVDIVIRLGQLDRHAASAPVMVLSVLAGLLVSFGAAYGGSMVYDYAFNVESIEGSTVYQESEEDQFPGRKRPPAQS